MSGLPVALAPGAEEDLREAFLWYRRRSPLAAQNFRTEVFEILDRLAHTARRWTSDESGLRRIHLKHFPFTVIFEVGEAEVTVLAVAHQRRRPRYWQGS